MLARERPENDDLVDPVLKLGPKCLADRAEHLLVGVRVLTRRETETRRLVTGGAEVGGQDDEAVPEVRRLACRVGEPALVEHL